MTLLCSATIRLKTSKIPVFQSCLTVLWCDVFLMLQLHVVSKLLTGPRIRRSSSLLTLLKSHAALRHEKKRYTVHVEHGAAQSQFRQTTQTTHDENLQVLSLTLPAPSDCTVVGSMSAVFGNSNVCCRTSKAIHVVVPLSKTPLLPIRHVELSIHKRSNTPLGS